jgi:hypothetical protein
MQLSATSQRQPEITQTITEYIHLSHMGLVPVIDFHTLKLLDLSTVHKIPYVYELFSGLVQ